MKKTICTTITALLLTLTGSNIFAMNNKNQNSDICLNRYDEPIDYNAFMLNKSFDKKNVSLSKKLLAKFNESCTEVHIFESKSKDDVFEEEPILVIPTEDVEYPRLLFSPDEKKIAIVNDIHEGSIKIYDIENNKTICELGIDSVCNSIFFSYDSTLIGYCSTNNFIEIINLKTQQTTWKHECGSDFLPDVGGVNTIMAQISHDNNYVVTVSQANDFDELEDKLEMIPKYITEAFQQYKNKKLKKQDRSFITNYVIKKSKLQSNWIYREYIKYIIQRIIKLKREQLTNSKIKITKEILIYPYSMLLQVWDIKNNNKIFSMPIFSYNKTKTDIQNLFITSQKNDHTCCWLSHNDGSITFCTLEKNDKHALPTRGALTTEYNYDESEKPLLRKFDRTGRRFETVQLDKYITNIDQELQKTGLSCGIDNQDWKTRTISAKDIANLQNKKSFSLIDFFSYAKASFNKKLFRGLVNMTHIAEHVSTHLNIPLEVMTEIVLYAGWENFAYKKMYPQKKKENN